MAHSLHTEIEISAPIDRVRAILTDFDRYPEWNPFIASISGDQRVGARLDVRIGGGASKSRFKPKVLAWEPPTRFIWEGSLPIPGLFVGRHEFILTELGTNQTHMLHQEFFRGLISGMLLKSIGEATRLGFTQMNEALKQRAENGN